MGRTPKGGEEKNERNPAVRSNRIDPVPHRPALLRLLGLKVRDLIGFTVVQFAINLPLVLLLLWALGATLPYHPPLAPH